jgi:chorismate synthase
MEWLSGLADGRTSARPSASWCRNEDARSGSYEPFRDLYRPSHADFTYDARYGHRTWAGGGRASARETVSRVAGGAIARQVLASLGAVEVVAWVDALQELRARTWMGDGDGGGCRRNHVRPLTPTWRSRR